MMHPKNAEDPTQYPEIIVAMAISIGAKTFVDHPLDWIFLWNVRLALPYHNSINY